MVSLEVQPLRSSFGKVFMGAAGTPTGPPVDDEFNRVSFLSHFEGANNGVNNAFDDGSASNHTVTANGNVTQGSFGPFARPDGEWGVDFDSSDVAPISAADSADWDFASGTFTVETFVFPTKLGTYQPIIVHWGDFSGNNIAWSLNLNNNDKWSFLFKIGSTVYEAGVGDAVVAAGLNQWYHLAAVRNGNNFTVYVNGTAYGTVITNAGTINNCTDVLRIGAYHATYTWTGNISNARIVKGTAVYTGNFTAPTSKLTAVTNTKLLTCQSNRFVDNSASPHTLTSSGKIAITAFGPFLTSSVYDPAVNGASAYLTLGDSDYLQMPAQTIPTGSYTLEGWYYIIGTGQGQTVISQGSSGTSNRTFFGMEGGQFTFQMGNTVERGPTIFRNSWNHFACVYNSSSASLQGWHNGVSTGSTSYSGGDAENVVTQIGTLGSNWGSGYGLTGYITDIRVSSGIKYTGNSITVPTSPLAVQDSNTKLLLNMADGQAIDSAAQNNLTLVGNTKISTGQAKFGDTSMLFDGSGDFALARNTTSFQLGSGNWTIETFVYAVGVSNTPYILDCRSSSSANEVVPTIYVNSSRLEFWVSNGARIQAGEDLSLNAWNHVAVCKSGSSTKLFINGTQSGSTYTDNNTYIRPAYVYLGLRAGKSDQSWNGYIDEFRVSKMARYTSNFTAPSAAFADKGQDV